MKIISIIPARGGSKSIPKKNLVNFLNEPLIAKTIQQSLKTKLINRTIVSTDNDEISLVAKEFGAEVVKRPNNISGDSAATESAILHTLKLLKENENYVPDIIILLQATSPLRRKDDISNAITLFINKKADSLISGSQFEDFLFWEHKNSKWHPVNYNPNNRMRRQDRKPQFVEIGRAHV